MHRNVHFWTLIHWGRQGPRNLNAGIGVGRIARTCNSGVAVDNDFEGDDA